MYWYAQFLQALHQIAFTLTCHMRLKPLHARGKKQDMLLAAANLCIINHQEDPAHFFSSSL